MATQITGISTARSAACFGLITKTDSHCCPFVMGIHRWPVVLSLKICKAFHHPSHDVTMKYEDQVPVDVGRNLVARPENDRASVSHWLCAYTEWPLCKSCALLVPRDISCGSFSWVPVMTSQYGNAFYIIHDDAIKWKHFPRNWPFVRGIHRSRWIPHTKASDAELWCFLWSEPE